MSIVEIIVTVGCTIAGSVAIAFTIFHLQEKSRRKALFRALYDEIRLNRSLAQETLNSLQKASEEVDARIMFNFLYTGAYESARLSGELSILNKDLRFELMKTYDKIYAYDRDAEYKYWHFELLKELIKRLEYFEKELPKYLKFSK